MADLRAVPKPPRREKRPVKGLRQRKELARRKRIEARARLRTRKRLAALGQRGRRLRGADRQMERETHAMACSCGCNAGRHEVARAHLDSRAYESTRNLPWNNVPACLYLSTWLDHNPCGVAAKLVLVERARERRERLDPDEIQAVLREFGYYTWLHDLRLQMR